MIGQLELSEPAQPITGSGRSKSRYQTQTQNILGSIHQNCSIWSCYAIAVPAAAGGGGAELSSVLESDEGNEYKEPVQLKVNHHGLLSSECLQWSKLKQLSCSQEIQFEKFTQNVHS